MSRATRTSKKDGETTKEAELACDLCDRPFTATEVVLYCEGSCRQRMHRHCAGVSKYHYLELKNSSTSFVCLICTQQLHKAEVQGLESVVAALKDELDSMSFAPPCRVWSSKLSQIHVWNHHLQKILCRRSRRMLKSYSLL